MKSLGNPGFDGTDPFVTREEGEGGGVSAPESDPSHPVRTPDSSPVLLSNPDLSEGQSPSARAKAEQVRLVFEHYRMYHPRSFPSPKATSKESRLIEARMREGYTVDDLYKAIDGYHRDPFHCGVNDRGTKYQSLALVMRDGSNVAKGIEYADAVPVTVSAKEVKNHAAGQAWLARMRGER